MTKHWPSWRYDPVTLQGQIFETATDVPPGWVERLGEESEATAASDDPPVKTAPVRKPATKAELTEALTAGGIPFDKNANRDALYDLLKGKVMEVLAQRNIPFDADADVRDLLNALG